MSPFNNPAKDFRLYPADAPHLARLSEKLRIPLQMADHDGKRYDEIAFECGAPEGTIKSRIHRARDKVLYLRAKAKADAAVAGVGQ